jgi:hypothetical protein
MADQPRAEEPAGVGTAIALDTMMQNQRLCAVGWHAWTPWLGLPTPEDPTRFVTICGREGCTAERQYDL